MGEKEFKLRAKIVVDEDSKKKLGESINSALTGDGGGESAEKFGDKLKDAIKGSMGFLTNPKEFIGNMKNLGGSVLDVFSKGTSGGDGGGGGGQGAMAAGGAAGLAGGAVVAAMSGIKEVMGKVLGMVKGLLTESMKMSPLLGQTLEMFKLMLGMIFKPLFDMIGMIMMPIFILLYKWFIIPFYQKIYPKILKLVEYIQSNKTLMQNIINLTVYGFAAVVGAILGVVAAFVIIVGVLAAILALWITFSTGYMAAMEWLGTKIANGINLVIEKFKESFWSVYNALVSAKSAILGGLKSAKDTVYGLPGRIKAGIQTVMELVKTSINSKLDGLPTPIKLKLQELKNAISGKLTSVISGFYNVRSAIYDYVKGPLDSVKKLLKDIIEGVADVVSEITGLFTSPMAMMPSGSGGDNYRNSNYQTYVTQNIYGSQDPEYTAQKTSTKLADYLSVVLR